MWLLFSLILFTHGSWAQTSTTPAPQPHFQSQQDSFGSRSIGHLVTGNTEVLNRGEISLGTLWSGVGFTDRLTVATSPFVWLQFDMPNALARYGWSINERRRLAVDASYFKTNPRRRTEYQVCGLNDCWTESRDDSDFKMEAWSAEFTFSERMFSFYRANVGLGYFYYIDDTKPFSLRMDPANGDRYALNLTTLHELRLSRHFFFNLELGGWGLNYRYPYAHTGATIGLQNRHLLMSLGASTTFSPGFPKEKAKVFVGYDSRQSVHPEFQVQVFF